MSKLHDTLLKKYGSEEGIRRHYREIAKLGGQARVPKGFAKMDKDKHKDASSRGGQVKRKEAADV